jgi:hypothetical protein
MASSNYQPAIPANASSLEEGVKRFISEFYATSDNPARNDEWVDYFAPDAVLIMGDRTAKGTEGRLS